MQHLIHGLVRGALAAWILPVMLPIALAADVLQEGTLRPAQLRCEYRTNPTGLDVVNPRLSWIVESNQRGQRQTAYQILAASSEEALAADQGDLWDSGRVVSSRTVHVVYAGQPLKSRMRVWWKIRVWDKDRRSSAWSVPASWTMGLLTRSDWQAQWIADPISATRALPPRAHNGYHSQLAPHPDTPKWVTLDLGRPFRVDTVRLFPARPFDWVDTPGFLFPPRFKIETSSKADFSDARVVIHRTQSDEPNPGTNAPMYEFEPATARFIRLTATRLSRRDGTNYGFALAEMQVFSGRTNLALGAKITALDSIESGGWGLTHLADGVSGTVQPGGVLSALPATMVRKSFSLSAAVRRATAYASGLGLYELRLNGHRVGDQLLAPEWTSYRRRVQYQTYDVTPFLRPGENTAGALLGEGWYAGRLMVVGPFPYGTHPRFLLQLEIELVDGSRKTIVTDDSWRSTLDGPVRAAGIYDGETYDARREQPGWDMAGFDDRAWSPVQASSLDARQLVWQRNEPIQAVMDLKPLRLTEPKPGVFVFDLGQNMVGWCHVKAQGRTGQTVTIRHAEMLNEDGTLYTANLRGAPQVDRYVPRTDGEFVYEPRFTYHGFRFVELTGLDQPPAVDAVLGRVMHSASPVVGSFECSDPGLNQLFRNILWTQRANLMSSPNDCPQRDERFGWMGDIQAFSQTAIFNMDLGAFFTKFAQDIRDDQADDGRFPDFAPHPGNPNLSFSGAPAWGDAGTIVPWRVYQNYADDRLIARHFTAARRWVDYVHKLNPNLIWIHGRQNDYNDWLNGDWIRQADWPAQGGSVPKEVFATAFFAHSTELTARMAEALGRKTDARRYRRLFHQIKSAFNERFVKPNGRILGDTQGGYALALSFNLLPENLRPQAARHLTDNIRQYHNHLSTGIQTTHRAMLELPRFGYSDLAWQLLTNRTFPSWLYMIDNGATTIWERWDGYVRGRGFQDAGMNSFNHWAFGAVGEWMWRQIAGLNPDENQPGWQHFFIAPRPGGGVTWAKAEYQSIRGRIASEWHLNDHTFTLQLLVPANTTATLSLPAAPGSMITESGGSLATADGVKILRRESDRVLLSLNSGGYRFRVGPDQTAPR
ncbi:MAG TPA: family 78 glycoside hydrolase catalytic domain [Candidatus Paceibacterota bacterium]|nr:family 78 glycoside hydrolase catalytic domain [Verrucomicrobiota bacterium]HRY51609.1 family 78 glycoside hydrolase catalytic domain [Candidatus Paceibacterota bacterium]